MANMETQLGQRPAPAQPTSAIAPIVASPSKPRRGLAAPASIFILIALVVSGGVWWKRHRAVQASAGASAAGRGAGALGPVPVAAATVSQKDVPIYLDGLGTVQAFNTVTVRARVDGQVEKIAFVEGQDVRAGDLLAQIDPAPFKAQLDQNIAKQAQDQAQLTAARVTLQRDAALLADKILSQQDYDTQKATVDQLAAAVQADEAAVNNAKVQLAYTTITSPLEGRAGIRQVDQGNIVHASDSNGLVVIAQLRPISILFTLPEQNLLQIQDQLNAGRDLPVLAVDRDNRTPLDEGKLAVVDNQIDTSTGTIRLKATFPNEKLHLWPGQFVNARLLVSTRKNGTVVPASVVQRGPDGSYAFVVKPDSSVEVRPVQVAHIEQGDALIEFGLKVGEQVVVDGQYRLQPGSRVKLASTASATSPAKPGLPGQSHTPPVSGGSAGP